MIRTLCIYCGSSDKVSAEYLQAACEMGETVARRGIRLAYGAGKTGLMGAVANGVLAAGGEVVGVIPAMFHTPQLVHTGLTQLEVVESMHARKARLAQIADAFVALPGGYGTFEELFEILTWAQIGLHSKPVGLLNSRRYFDPLLAMVQHAWEEGMIYDEHRALFVHSEDPHQLLDALENHHLPDGLERWWLRND